MRHTSQNIFQKKTQAPNDVKDFDARGCKRLLSAARALCCESIKWCIEIIGKSYRDPDIQNQAFLHGIVLTETIMRFFLRPKIKNLTAKPLSLRSKAQMRLGIKRANSRESMRQIPEALYVLQSKKFTFGGVLESEFIDA